MKLGKKGDQWAALLIAVIGLAIILYILMLPPADRAELLGENITYSSSSGNGDDGGSASEQQYVEVILQKEPGVIEFLADDVSEIDIPSFNIFTKTEGTVLASFDSIYIRKSVFSESVKNITFKIDDLEFTENALLSFTAKNRTGRLSVSLNGEELLNKELDTDSPAPIKLLKSDLREENILVFEVSGPGAEFWKANEYILENIQITADITDISGQENKQFFILTEQQKNLLEKADISFVADCSADEAIPMETYVNKKLIYSGIPDCGGKTELPLDAEKLVEGENNLWFRSEGGNYLLYSIKVVLDLKKPITPTYYFDLSDEQFKKIEDGDGQIDIELVFANSDDYKKGTVKVNDGTLEIETQESSMERSLDPYVRAGNNVIEIIPERNDLQIIEVSVVYGE